MQAVVEGKAVRVEQLALDDIVVDERVQRRYRGLDNDTVYRYLEHLKSGGTLPSLVIFQEDYHGNRINYLADGFHRHEAHQRNGSESVECEIHEGDLRDAILYAAGANENHGLLRSDDDKMWSVLTLLTDEHWGKFSDREIAVKTKTSNGYVSKLRRFVNLLIFELHGETNYNIISNKLGSSTQYAFGLRQMVNRLLTREQQRVMRNSAESTTRSYTKNGKTHTMDVSNIGTNGNGHTNGSSPTVYGTQLERVSAETEPPFDCLAFVEYANGWLAKQDVECDPAVPEGIFEMIGATYSAERISSREAIKKPYHTVMGDFLCTTRTGMRVSAYRVIPIDAYGGPTVSYEQRNSPELEAIDRDLRFSCHGLEVWDANGVELVLVGPRVDFTVMPEPEEEIGELPDGLLKTEGGDYVMGLPKITHYDEPKVLYHFRVGMVTGAVEDDRLYAVGERQGAYLASKNAKGSEHLYSIGQWDVGEGGRYSFDEAEALQLSQMELRTKIEDKEAEIDRLTSELKVCAKASRKLYALRKKLDPSLP